MTDSIVELVLKLYPLNGVQTLLRNGRREVTDDWEVKEAESVFTISRINGFAIAVVMSKRSQNCKEDLEYQHLFARQQQRQ